MRTPPRTHASLCLSSPPSTPRIKTAKPSGATEVGHWRGGDPSLRPLGEIQGEKNETTAPSPPASEMWTVSKPVGVLAAVYQSSVEILAVRFKAGQSVMLQLKRVQGFFRI